MRVDLSRVKSLIFDVDGTLYLQGPLRRAMLLKLIKEAVRKPVAGIKTFRVLRAYRQAQEFLRDSTVEGALATAQLRLACKNAGQPEEVLSTIVTRWMENEPLELLEGLVTPALRNLLIVARERGLRLGILSDYPAAAKLDAMRLTEFFDVLVSAQDPAVNCFKPHPRGLIETMRRLKVDATEALYIGDRHDVDGQAARRAGVTCVVVGRRTRGAKGCVCVPDYHALHALLFSSPGEKH